ncbi:flagellar hook-length control protein FliK [Planococcus antarcticus DSM 14505]|uniref:Flagellar hook-length control protein FliK n=1 Tax=Planococcus antarcticus DSM 14505 TaxID=1185653 RepID=A0ABM6D1M1_9BACL|nr:flagellar hook-length control protein FliK [Planococcus antarcticus]ANU09172.1 flagellar hook-length control protein FliK [Planococcus antarcticus DSM 14505]
MEALKLSFPQTISPASKKAAVPVQDQALFASLLNSLGTEAELPSEEQAPAEELLKSLESLLTLLQELPVEEEMVEQPDIQYAILQLQELLAGNTQLYFTAPGQMAGGAANAADKLIGLLEKIQQKLQVLSSEFTAKFIDPLVFKGTEEKNSNINLASLTQISEQLDKLIGILEKQPQTTSASQQGKSIGQELVNLLPVQGLNPAKEALRFLNETLKPVKELPRAPVEIQGIPQQVEVVELQPAGKLQAAEELQSPKVLVESKVALEPAVQPTATVAAEAVKAAGNQVRTEANPPAAPFVRLSNLLEDLSGMLKSSMRLAETTEGMKMRVNIFPEHLGHLEILLTSTNGKLAAQIMASTPMAKEALELQLNQLRASLVQQGVAVEKIEVLQQSSQQPFSQQHSHTEQRFSQQQQRNGTTRQDKNGYFQPEEEKAVERQPSVGQLMKVDYTV